MTPSKALFYFCISFILGVCLESLIYSFAPEYLKSQVIYIILGFFVGAIAIIGASFFLKKSLAVVLGFCLLFLVLGMLRFQITEFTIANNILQTLNDKSKVTITGVVSNAPDIRGTYQNITVLAQKILLDGKELPAEGKILATVGLYQTYHYLDTITFTGKLEAPKVFDDFNYKNYLLKDGIFSVAYYPKIVSVDSNHHYNVFTFLYEKILFFKEKLVDSINTNFPSPQNFILEGVVLGNDKNMPTDLKDKFNITGLSHLTAVSGSNIVILISVVMAFLLFLGMWRPQAFYVSIIFIWAYILLVGLPVSGIRAAIMGSITLLAQKLGRQNTSSRVLIIAAFLMLLQNPLLLEYDISFQLSFLASLGIIYVKPLLDTYLKIISKDKFNTFFDIISVTAAAQLLALPIIACNFGVISLVAPITNILVLPIIPMLTILGVLTSLCGVFSGILARFFLVPCWFLLQYLLEILDVFSQPWAQATIQEVSWMWLVLYYAVLCILIKVLQRFQKPTFLGY